MLYAKMNLHFDINFASPSVVQPLNAPFFPPLMGGWARRAKRESMITCMCMLRTKQSKQSVSKKSCVRGKLYFYHNCCQSRNFRSPTTLLASICHAMLLFSDRAVKKKTKNKNIFFDFDIVVKNIKT